MAGIVIEYACTIIGAGALAIWIMKLIGKLEH